MLELPVGTVSSRLARGRTAMLSLFNGAGRRFRGRPVKELGPHTVNNSNGASHLGGWSHAQPAFN